MAKTAAPTPYDRITELREARGLSIRALARAAGLSHTVLINAASTRRLDLDSIAAFAGALEVPVSQLLGEAPSPAATGAAPADLPKGAAAGTTLRLALRQLIAGPLNPRKTFDDASIAELADNIAAIGLLQNLTVRPHEAMGPGTGQTLLKTRDQGAMPMFEIVAGERRYRALCLLAERNAWNRSAPTIECRVVQGGNADHIALAIIENLQREEVPPYEEARGFADLMALDPARWTTAKIAEMVGKTQRFVQLRLQLANRLSPEALKAMEDGKINLDQATALSTVSGKQQVKALQSVVQGQWGWKNGKEISEKLHAELPPASAALFKVEEYQGEWAEDGKARRFADRAAFDQLQAAAVKTRLAKYEAEGWAFVAKAKGDWLGHRYQEADQKDKPQPGKTWGIVALHKRNGAVEFLKCKDREAGRPASGGSQRDDSYEREKAARERRNAHTAQWLEALRARVASDPDLLIASAVARTLLADRNPMALLGDLAPMFEPFLNKARSRQADEDRTWREFKGADDCRDFFRAALGLNREAAFALLVRDAARGSLDASWQGYPELVAHGAGAHLDLPWSEPPEPEPPAKAKPAKGAKAKADKAAVQALADDTLASLGAETGDDLFEHEEAAP